MSTLTYTLFPYTTLFRSDEIAVRVGKLVEPVVEHRLAEEDHAVGAAAVHHGQQIVDVARRGVADGEVAIARARRFADAREQFEEEGMRQRQRRSEEHTSELQSLMRISYDVFCLKKK